MAMSGLLLLNMPLEDTKVQVEIQEREMSLETFQVRIGEAEAKTNDLKASFGNLCGMVKMPQDASSSTVRDTLIQSIAHTILFDPSI
ncbi:uncharacterized protein Pyn_39421 [Prunus yedoensis var. nudiflora]|uniref:Uncharacterized protein n=1 Tax=Prunus yedoensis var. nudiflora TaxID=2094558 RepID=A0A314Z611_PRUYE|nr:uncharacterized protein Pyn_39421 [Prunus yedoensis var. nudiflora]